MLPDVPAAAGDVEVAAEDAAPSRDALLRMNFVSPVVVAPAVVVVAPVVPTAPCPARWTHPVMETLSAEPARGVAV